MIYEMLAHIKIRSGMYLGRPSITALSHYVHGFEHAMTLSQLPAQEDDEDFQQFKQWMETKFLGANLGWRGQILLLVEEKEQFAQDKAVLEEQALDQFFMLLEQYSVLFRQKEQQVRERLVREMRKRQFPANTPQKPLEGPNDPAQ